MKKELEQYLWLRIRKAGEEGGLLPRNIIEKMIAKGMIKSPKQAWRTLEKWLGKGMYSYGVTIDLGWRRQIPELSNPQCP